MKQSRSGSALLVICAFVSVPGLSCSKAPDQSNAAVNASAKTATNTTSTPANAAPASIAGSYDTTGTNADGAGAYKSTLEVTPRDDVYQFSWSSGGKSFDGVGVMTDRTVAVSYTDGTDGKGCGVILYRIGADGSLDGTTGYWGVNKAEKEKAVASGDGKTGIDRDYNVTGSSTDNKEYKGTLTVKREGPKGYKFLWNAGGVFEGFGIKIGDKVAVGFGGDRCSFMAYEVKPDGTLEGRWGGQSSTSFGTEIAKKK